MKTMKQAGITQKQIVDFIIADIQKEFDLSKTQASEYFNEALAYNTVTAEIIEKIAYMLENPKNRLDWSREMAVAE